MPAIIAIGEPLPEEVWQDMVENHIPVDHPIGWFIHDLILTKDLSLQSSGLILELPESVASLEEVLVEAKVFASRNIARKNGFGGPIQSGITMAGPKANRIWIWKR